MYIPEDHILKTKAITLIVLMAMQMFAYIQIQQRAQRKAVQVWLIDNYS